ncbi:TraV family lipoprotein [Aeromonas salmonicida]|uniref:TraV family lipoprotein n=1 Tax=Aeromonas salmonicida TaxID=645 RepID=UPI001E5E92C0|nr:TraV family lipoprotein [Aeromonas salmonicida]
MKSVRRRVATIWAKPRPAADRCTASVWIAPWIDASDVFHQPGRVSFVVTPGTWQLPQQLK